MKTNLLVASISLIGLEMGISAGIGVAVGLYLDNKFDTSPWLLMLFLLLGIAAGMRRIYVVAKKLEKEQIESEQNILFEIQTSDKTHQVPDEKQNTDSSKEE